MLFVRPLLALAAIHPPAQASGSANTQHRIVGQHARHAPQARLEASLVTAHVNKGEQALSTQADLGGGQAGDACVVQHLALWAVSQHLHETAGQAAARNWVNDKGMIGNKSGMRHAPAG